MRLDVSAGLQNTMGSWRSRFWCQWKNGYFLHSKVTNFSFKSYFSFRVPLFLLSFIPYAWYGVCVCVHVLRCKYICMLVEVRGQPWLLFFRSCLPWSLFCFEQGLSLAWYLPSSLGYLASKPQWFAAFCLSISGIKSVYHYTLLFFLNIGSKGLK